MKRTLKRKEAPPPKRRLLQRSTSSPGSGEVTRKRSLVKRASPSSQPASVRPAKKSEEVDPFLRATKPKSRPAPKIPKGFKWKGRKYQHDKKLVMVDQKNMPETFPRFSPTNVPNTFWLVDPATNSVIYLTSVIGERHYGWSSCGVCMNVAARCFCANGIVNPRSIEHIHILQMMKDNEIPIAHPIDSTSPMVTQYGLRWYRDKSARIAPGAPLASRPRKATPLTRKPARSKPVASEPLPDLATVNRAAEADAEETTKRLTRVLSGSAASKTPKKRSLKRKD
jgi:hypothetical protein